MAQLLREFVGEKVPQTKMIPESVWEGADVGMLFYVQSYLPSGSAAMKALYAGGAYALYEEFLVPFAHGMSVQKGQKPYFFF